MYSEHFWTVLLHESFVLKLRNVITKLLPTFWLNAPVVFRHWWQLKHSVETSAKIPNLKLVSESLFLNLCKSRDATARNKVCYNYSLCLWFSLHLQLQIWDMAGQERYKAITWSHYHSANAIVLVYDIGDTTSFRNLPEWLSDVERCAGSNITRILVGNSVRW